MSRKSKLWEYFNQELKSPEFKKMVQEEDNKLRLALNIIKLREKNNITQARLAQILGTKQSSVSRWEKEGFTKTNLETIQKIVNVLGAKLEIKFKRNKNIKEKQMVKVL